MSNDDFDDMGMMRRKVLALEQANGDLGETIGVLKQERARLWGALSDCLAPLQDAYNSTQHTGHETQAARAFIAAKQSLEQVRLDR